MTGVQRLRAIGKVGSRTGEQACGQGLSSAKPHLSTSLYLISTWQVEHCVGHGRPWWAVLTLPGGHEGQREHSQGVEDRDREDVRVRLAVGQPCNRQERDD